MLVLGALLGGSACKGCKKSPVPADGAVAARSQDGGGGSATATQAKTPPPSSKAWEPLVALVPEGAPAVAVIADIPGVLRGAREALAKLRGTFVGMTVEETLRAALHKMGLSGLDAFDAAAWGTRGFDVARGALMAQFDDHSGFLAFGVSEPAKVEPILQAFLKRAEEVATFQKQPDGTTLGLRANGKARAGYTFRAGLGILVSAEGGSGPDVAELLKRVLRPAGKRFTDSTAYRDLLAAADLGRGINLILTPALIPTLPADVRGVFKSFRGLNVRVDLAGGAVALDAYLPTTAATARSIRGIVPAGTPGPGLARALGDDTLLALAARADVSAAIQLALGLAPSIRELVTTMFERLKKKFDIDVQKELIDNLAGDAAMALHRLDADVVAAMIGGGMADALAADPFHMTMLMRVKDGVVASKFVRKMAALTDAGVEKVGAVDVFPVPLMRVASDEEGTSAKAAGPVLRFALSGDTLVLTTGKGRMQKALAALAAKDPPFTPRVLDADARARLIDRPSAPAAYLVVPTLLANLKDLDSAFLKKGASLVSSIVVKAVEMFEKIADVTVVTEPLERGLRGFLRVRFQ
jgi:hypothetical protein